MKYRPRSAWPPLLALLAAGAIMVVSVSVGLAAANLAGTWLTTAGDEIRTGTSMLAMQTAAAVLAVVAARGFGGRPREVLSLGAWPGWRTAGLACLGVVLLLAPYNLVVYLIAPQSITADLAPFKKLIDSPAGPMFFLVVAVGAPLSEELVFRGFLQSALTPSRLGFAGAAVITTALWTGLHAGYSIAGLLEVFIVGIYFAFLLWWTGSLWVPIFCHAAYNAVLFAVLRYVPLPI